MDKVISFLINRDGFISGEEIAKSLNISRTAIWKHIQNARKAGFIITSSTKKGYKINKIPDNKIIPELIGSYYGNTLPYDIIYLDKVDSTNNYAKELILQKKNENFIIISEEQIKGKGRQEKVWTSEKGKDLTFSFGLRIDKSVSEFYKFTIISGLTVFLTLQTILNNNDNPSHIYIKWPNDIYINDRKICGILSEMITEEMQIKYIVIGIGINVNSKTRLPQAISLKDIIMKESDRNETMTDLIKIFKELFLKYEKGEYEAIFDLWKENLGWIGKKISFNTGRGIITGILKDIDKDGAVIIQSDNKEQVYYSGDIII